MLSFWIVHASSMMAWVSVGHVTSLRHEPAVACMHSTQHSCATKAPQHLQPVVSLHHLFHIHTITRQLVHWRSMPFRTKAMS
jgi:NAD(P)H-dependent FMN reductase